MGHTHQSVSYQGHKSRMWTIHTHTYWYVRTQIKTHNTTHTHTRTCTHQVRKWGTAFEQLEEEAFELFSRLHSFSIAPVGRLTKNEFAGALRLMGADRGKESFDRLLHFMFEAIDLQRTGPIRMYVCVHICVHGCVHICVHG